jgi:hypothetical protein
MQCSARSFLLLNLFYTRWRGALLIRDRSKKESGKVPGLQRSID